MLIGLIGLCATVYLVILAEAKWKLGWVWEI